MQKSDFCFIKKKKVNINKFMDIKRQSFYDTLSIF